MSYADVVYYMDLIAHYQSLIALVDDFPAWQRSAKLDEYELNLNFCEDELLRVQSEAAEEEISESNGQSFDDEIFNEVDSEELGDN